MLFLRRGGTRGVLRSTGSYTLSSDGADAAVLSSELAVEVLFGTVALTMEEELLLLVEED